MQAYIPEFRDVVGQMQFDLFHTYTVDEHTFKVVRNMRQMRLNKQTGFELEHELINKLSKIEILYVAGLFHDLGKGKGGDHSAQKLEPRQVKDLQKDWVCQRQMQI